jgi:uncharacterized membrane protein
MNAPRTIADYLEQLREALRGADPALVQDALYDAEEHLRAELAEEPGRSEADMLAHVVNSYGAPDEVADLYRDQEIKIQRALRPPPAPRRTSPIGRFFGVAADSHTYGALFYMLLCPTTGIFYFTWAVTGLSLSAGLSLLIVGAIFFVLFIGTVRGLSLLEGRIVETMLGVRMPRRPPYPSRDLSLLKRIGGMFADARTWTTLLYMVLMLPLGIVYFTISVFLVSVSLACIATPLAKGFFDSRWVSIQWDDVTYVSSWPDVAVVCVFGVLLLFASLHLVRAMGRMQGQIAKHLLVKTAQG